MAQFTAHDAIAIKVDTLYRDRRLGEHLQFSGLCLSAREEVERELQGIQKAIYVLDRYGEDNWKIDARVLDEIWAGILEAIDLFGLGKAEALALSSDIRRYQGVEVGLRNAHYPTDVPLFRFYKLKTCDVRLARNLILRTGSNELLEPLVPLWECFDLASEVLDDIADVNEDCRDFNCNRFLIESTLFGPANTRLNYTMFLHQIRRRATELMVNSCVGPTPEGQTIWKWTLDQIAETKLLLQQNWRFNASSTRMIIEPRLLPSAGRAAS